MEDSPNIFHERCRFLADASPIATLISASTTGTILYANARAAAMFHTSISQMLGRHTQEFYQEPEPHAHLLHLLKTEGRVPDQEMHAHQADGSSFWVLRTLHALTIGEHTALVAGLYDVTARHNVEAALRASEERYRALFENNPSMYFTVNPEGVVVAVNRYGAEQLGYTPAELIGNSVLGVFHADDQASIAEQLQNCLAEPERVHHWELRKVHRNGQVLWVKEAARAMREADGRLLVLIVCEDLTERRRTEEEVRKLNHELEQRVFERTAALHESETKFRQLAENIHAVFWMNTPAADNLVYVSPAYERIWGRPATHLAQKPRAFLDDIYPDDRAVMMALLQRQARGERYEGEYRIVRPDGDIRWIHDRGFPITDARGEVYRFAGIAEDVTEHKRAEAALRISEERYRTLAESSQDFVFILNRAGQIEYVNEAGARNFHRTPVEVTGKHLSEIFPATEWPRLWQRVLHVFEHGVATHGEIEVLFPHGKLWIDNQLVPLRDQTQKISAVMGVSRNISARKRMEQHLAESERFFRGAFDHAPIGMAIVNPAGRFIKVNDAFAEMLGYAQAELLDVTFQSITHPDDLAFNLDLMQQNLTQGSERYHLEKRYVHKDGHTVWANLSVSIVRDDNGVPLHLVTKIRDITASRVAAEALRVSEERYRTLAESAQDFVYIIGRSGEIQYLNHFAAAFFQRAPAAIIGKHIRELFPPEEYARLWQRMQTIFDRGIALDREAHIHFPHQSLWVDNRLVPLRDREHNVYAVMGISRDITKRKQLEEQLRQYNSDLETRIEERTRQIRELEKQNTETEKLAATGRMAARIAHEINNPLSFLQVAFQLISRDVSPQSRHYHYLAKIEKEIARIAGIIRQMLDLHRPQQELPTKFWPAETIEEVLLLTQPFAAARGITFEVETTTAQQSLHLPENMLRQVLHNVILNAVEASPAGARVKIIAQVAAAVFIVNVIDEGQGIPEELQARIFEPFFTTKSATKHSGMGLGLSICKSLVEAMQGSIKITSQVGGGTSCVIALPLAHQES